MFVHLDIIMVASISKNTLSFLTDNCDGLLLTGGVDIDPGVLQLNNINFFETLDIALFFCQFFCIFYSYFLVLCDIIVSGGVSYG